jgi:hypothetical protein
MHERHQSVLSALCRQPSKQGYLMLHCKSQCRPS